jgi:hypothetical protein
MAEVVKRGCEYKNDEFEVNLALANNKERREKENIIIFGLKRKEDRKVDERQALELVETLEAPRDQVLRATEREWEFCLTTRIFYLVTRLPFILNLFILII